MRQSLPTDTLENLEVRKIFLVRVTHLDRMKGNSNSLTRAEKSKNRPTIITTPAPPIESEEIIVENPISVRLNEPFEKKENNQQGKGSHQPRQKSYEYIIEEEISYKARRRLIYKEEYSSENG